MTADDFERALDAEPGNLELRSVYADWLHDHGAELEEACQRWMVREARWPWTNAVTTLGGKAGWWRKQVEADTPHTLPVEFNPLLDGRLGPWCRDNRRDAEAALRDALVSLGWIGMACASVRDEKTR